MNNQKFIAIVNSVLNIKFRIMIKNLNEANFLWKMMIRNWVANKYEL